MCHIFFIHSSVDGHLGCFHVLAIVNSAAVNIGVHVSFWIMVFSGYMPSSGIAGSYGSSRNPHSWDCSVIPMWWKCHAMVATAHLFHIQPHHVGSMSIYTMEITKRYRSGPPPSPLWWVVKPSAKTYTPFAGSLLCELQRTKGRCWPGPGFSNNSASLKGNAHTRDFITALRKNVWPMKEIAA